MLAYHNVVPGDAPPSSGDRSLHLPFDRFRRQLDLIEENRLDVVGLDAAVPERGAPPQIVFTFDDAYASALGLAIPELARRRWPATIFVAPGLLDRDLPWWDRFSQAASGGVPDAMRETALERAQGDEPQVLELARHHTWPMIAADPVFRIGAETDLMASLEAHPGLTLGAHSWSHPNLAQLAPDRLDDELLRPLVWLRDRWPDRTIAWLAYPYGRTSPTVQLHASRTGYHGALLVGGGWAKGPARARTFIAPRFTIPSGLSPRGFLARIAGVIQE